jgi:hypothetical protein
MEIREKNRKLNLESWQLSTLDGHNPFELVHVDVGEEGDDEATAGAAAGVAAGEGEEEVVEVVGDDALERKCVAFVVVVVDNLMLEQYFVEYLMEPAELGVDQAEA